MNSHEHSTSDAKSIGELTENIVRRLATSGTRTLQGSIYRYRGELNLHMAASFEAEDRGEPDDIPHNYRHATEVLERWDRPATSCEEAKMALQLALDDYEIGDTPRIPAMINAALGWISAEQKRRAAA